jgi:outer membrane protein assembly factor BamB
MLQVNTKWYKKYQGMMRVPFFENASSRYGFIVIYNEMKRVYSLVKFDAQNSEIIWETIVQNGGYGTPALNNGLVLMPTSFSKVTAISSETGLVEWEFETNSRIRGSVHHDGVNFCVSSGSGLYFLDSFGNLKSAIKLEGYICYGEPLITEDERYTLATSYVNHSSHISVLCFSRSGEIKFAIDIGKGVIASSDSSGITLVDNKYLAIGGDEKIVYADRFSGQIIWEANVPGYASRHRLTADSTQIYVTTLSGYVGAFKKDSGEEVWQSHYKVVPTTPIQLIHDAAVFVADGYLNFLSKVDGTLIDRKAVGHSPYSIPMFHNNCIYLGAGEPPYEGYMWCFEVKESTSRTDKEFSISANEINCYDDAKGFDLNVAISGIKTTSVSADFAVISDQEEIIAKRLTDQSFGFHNILIKPNAGAGIFIIPIKIISEEKCYFDAVIIELRRRKMLPSFKLIGDVPLISQQADNLSGAAVVQAIYQYYGAECFPSQNNIREMIDFVKSKSNYLPFDTWRIILRRILNSSAKSAQELPEYEITSRAD